MNSGNYSPWGPHGWGPLVGSGIGTALASTGWVSLLANPNSWLAAISILGGCCLAAASYYNLVREKIEVGNARRNLIAIQQHINEQNLVNGKPLIDLLNTGVLGGGGRSQSELQDVATRDSAVDSRGYPGSGADLNPPKLGRDTPGGKGQQ